MWDSYNKGSAVTLQDATPGAGLPNPSKLLAAAAPFGITCCPVPRNATIRPVEQGDAEAIAAIYAPNVTDNVISFELEPPDAQEFRRRIAGITATHPWLVCELGGEVVGYVYGATHNTRAAYQWSTNVTVYIDPARRRSGIGRALYASLFEVLKLQGFYNAYGGITLPNAGSVGLHEAMGFRLVGVYKDVGYKFGAWHDVGWWGLNLQPKPTGPPHAPLGPLAVQTDLAWQTAFESGLPLLRT